MTHKEEWDKCGFPFTDFELVIGRLTVTTHANSGGDFQILVNLFDEYGAPIWGVWPYNQDLPIEVGRYKARQYHLTGSMTILTERL